MAGTVEGVVLALGRALEPLEQRLQSPQTAILLFEELGLPLPPEVRTAVAAATELPEAATAVGLVTKQVPPLIAAIGQRDPDAIKAAVEALAPPAATAFAKLKALAERVKGAYPADLGAFSADVQSIIKQLPERLLSYVLVGYLEGDLPILARSLALLGLTDNTPVPATAEHPAGTRRGLRLDRVGTFFDDPALVFEQAYGWSSDTTALQAEQLFDRLGALLDALALPSALDPTVPALHTPLFRLAPGPGPGGPGTLPTSLEATIGTASLTGMDLGLSPPGSDWDVRVRASGTLEIGGGVRLRPPATLEILTPTGAVSGEVTLTLARVGPADRPLLLFGELEGTRLTAAALRVAVGAAFTAGAGGVQAGLVVEAGVDDGQLVVSFADSDGFLASLLPEALQLDFAIGARWTEKGGLVFEGGAGLMVVIPLDLALGPARLDKLELGVRLVPGAAPTIAIEARIAGGLTLGPFAASVDGVGAALDLLLRGGQADGTPPPAALDLGPVALALRFLPPRGLGLSIMAKPISGGGFILFDEPAGRYAGVLQLKLSTIGVTAIGILDTKLPGGATGFALLVVLRAEFPAIQLGFGIALSSVGGLLGLNRRVDVDALRQRFASGAVGRILSPEDPIRNAPLLLQELGAIFPVTPGVTVLGPTLQLTWAELVRLDLGVFIELPGPSKIVLLGSARASIENPSGGGPYLQIRLDILGVLDFTKRVLEFDAVLIDSQLLEVFELTGGAAFRLSWGDQPYVVLSIGGFHPSYNPAPLSFPSTLTRIAMVRGQPDDLLYLRFEGYFAITTNTLQFGAAVQVIVNAGDIRAEGSLTFDALIRFQPFYFEFAFEASIRVKFRGITLAGVRISGVLSGPGPVTFTGELCIEILFFEICWSATFTIGSNTPPPVESVTSALPALGVELRAPTNLSTAGSDDPLVVLAPPKDATAPVLVPLGQLVWEQRRAPLGLLLQRFEGAPLERQETISVSGAQVTGPARDWFAPGSFAELSDSEALNRRAVEQLQSGAALGADAEVTSAAVTHTVTIDQYRVTAPPRPVAATPVPEWVHGAINRRDGVEDVPAGERAVTVQTETWTTADPYGGETGAGLSEAQAHQLARANGLVATAAGDRVAAITF